MLLLTELEITLEVVPLRKKSIDISLICLFFLIDKIA